MEKISVPAFIKELDACFAREDLAAAGRCLLEWQARAAALGDRAGELSVCNEAVGYYRQTGDAQAANAAIDRALALVRETGCGETVSGGTILLNCATTMKAFGRAAEALPLYAQAQRVFAAKLPANDPLQAGLYNNLALALQDAGEPAQAEAAFLRAISITERCPRCELETAVSCVNLAQLWFARDPLDDRVLPLMQRAYKILKNPAVEGYEKYAFTCRKCAPAFGQCGLFAAELDLNRKADAGYARAGAEQSVL
ncbi:MAG: tetratricopeptide repeat protein [Clostridia bacterium]|nr:tetratricopeptide repeat protein [Clostridia bacterium]